MFCVFNETTWQSQSLVDYNPATAASAFALRSDADGTSFYDYFDQSRCDPASTYGRDVQFQFTCDPTVPKLVVTSVTVNYFYCTYDVHIVTGYACADYVPPPPMSLSSTGGGNEFLTVGGHTFTSPQLAGVVVGAVAVLALLSAFCYLIGRRRKPAEETDTLMEGEGEEERPEGVVAFRLPVPRRPRPATRNSSTNDTTNNEQQQPGGMSHSVASSYGLV